MSTLYISHKSFSLTRTFSPLHKNFTKESAKTDHPHIFQHDPKLGSKPKPKKNKPLPGKKPFFMRGGRPFFWNEKPLPQSWKDLANYPEFKKLKPSEQKAIKLFYKQKGHAKLSLKEMGKLFGCSDARAAQWRDGMKEKCFVEYEKRFQKNKDGSISKRHARSYTYLTKEGREWFENILLAEFFQKVFGGLGQNGELRSKECQGEPAGSAGQFSLEKKVESPDESNTGSSLNIPEGENPPLETDDERHVRLETCLDSLLSGRSCSSNSDPSAEFKFKLLLKEYYFAPDPKKCHSKTLSRFYREDPKHIEAALIAMRRKEDKGFRIRDFWALFTYLLKQIKKKGHFQPWYAKLADDYSDALAGKETPETKKLFQGQATGEVISSLHKLQVETGQKLTRKDLGRLVRKRTAKLNVALNHVIYRLRLDNPLRQLLYFQEPAVKKRKIHCACYKITDALGKVLETVPAKTLVVEDEVLAKQKKAAGKAKYIFNLAPDKPKQPEHEAYLKKKQIGKTGDVRFGYYLGNPSLLLPLKTIDGKISSLQSIWVDDQGNTQKRFLSGGRKQGSFLELKPFHQADHIYVCEGYATGASIQQAVQDPVIVAFDSGNIYSVVKAIHSVFPAIAFGLFLGLWLPLNR